ncbi:hypothetical protein Lser_V15G38061 [Lactuca serriola]
MLRDIAYKRFSLQTWAISCTRLLEEPMRFLFSPMRLLAVPTNLWLSDSRNILEIDPIVPLLMSTNSRFEYIVETIKAVKTFIVDPPDDTIFSPTPSKDPRFHYRAKIPTNKGVIQMAK